MMAYRPSSVVLNAALHFGCVAASALVISALIGAAYSYSSRAGTAGPLATGRAAALATG